MRRVYSVTVVTTMVVAAACEANEGPVSPGPDEVALEASVAADTGAGIVIVGAGSPPAANAMTASRTGSAPSPGKPGSSSCVPAPPDVVSWWPGDGSAADIVGANDGTLAGGVTFGPGFVTSGSGEAFSLDGVDAIVRVAHSDDLDPTGAPGFTVQAWAKTHTSAGNGAVIGKGVPFAEQYVIDQVSGEWRGVVRLPWGPAVQIRTGTALQTDVWTHLALSWDGSRLRFYVDGSLVGSALVGAIRTSEDDLGIGARSEAGFPDDALQLEFDGLVDEVEFYGRALSAEEIAAIHAAGSAGTCKGENSSSRSPKAVAQSVTGSGRYEALPGTWRTFSFTARRHADGSVAGEWQLSPGASGTELHGDVMCFTVLGSQVWIGGVAERSADSPGEVAWRAVDNGQGAHDAPDRISLPLVGGAPGFAAGHCADTPASPALFDVRAGNVQIRN